MNITKISVVQNDALYDLNFTLTDNSGTPINLAGATILLKAQIEHTTTLKFTGSMSIVDASTGKCKYQVQATDFSQAGKYMAEIQVTIGTQIITYSGIIINVEPELPRT